MYFKKIFEQVKYFRKVFKYKYFKKYLNTFKYKCIWPHVWTHLIYYSFEYAPLVLKCYCNVFDHVYLKFLNASYLYLIQKP